MSEANPVPIPAEVVRDERTPAAQPRAVLAEIEFLDPHVERPFAWAHETPPRGAAPTARFVSHAVRIEDVRGREPLRLDEQGAMLLHSPTRVRRFSDEAHVRERYYRECAEIIRAAVDADRVIVFDHNVRRGSALPVREGRRDLGRPVHHAHTDYTARSALARLRKEMGAQAEKRLSRYLQVNLWRPIREPVRDAPLALCDGASVTPGALRRVELRYPERTGEIYYLMHARQQRWYYASDMAIDEAWLFKNFDSAPPGRARAAPHSAFTDRRHQDAPPRESIEVRALAIFS
ncbi:MAG TPA: CmcJ/NvfI family oxidoreductase [Steroidobacteraceae bacterium]|nr:CmcJ/NvfI family oxidoreductase [Steroidobacteraceae bacterium]